MEPSNRNMLLIGAIVVVTSVGYYMQWRTKCVVPSCPPCPQPAESVPATTPALPEITATPTPAAAAEQSPAPTEQGIKNITTEKEFNELIATNDKPVVVKVHAPWCGPCKGLKPVFEKVAREFNDTIIFAEINQDEFENSELLNVTGIPALICYKNGQEMSRLTGRDYATLKKELTALIAAKEL